jgi:hypothetical protein
MTDPIRNLQSAAASVARHVAGTVAGRVIVFGPDGRKLLDIAVPAMVAESPAVPAEPEIVAGWHFTPAGPKFDGRPIAIRGRQLTVLKMLAAAEGPVAVPDLRGAWDGYDVEAGTIRGAIIELRKSLKREFPDWEESVTAKGDGYTLLIR